MVKNILNLFIGNTAAFIRVALILAISSVVSAAFGLLRDTSVSRKLRRRRIFGHLLRRFQNSDFIYIISLSIISVNALIPFFLEKATVSNEQAKKFLDETLSFFLLAIFFLTAGAYVLIPYLAGLVAPGFGESSKSEFVFLARILLLSPVFLGLSNLVSSVIQSHNRFIVYALSPVFYNLGIIFGLIFLFPRFGLAGNCFRRGHRSRRIWPIQIPAIIRLGFFPWPAKK